MGKRHPPTPDKWAKVLYRYDEKHWILFYRPEGKWEVYPLRHPTVCEHCHQPLEMMWDDDRDCYICENCFKGVAVNCPLCGGEGFMSEDEMECDWVNYTDELVTCRECRGEGWTANPSFA
jgi:hypothetical protein